MSRFFVSHGRKRGFLRHLGAVALHRAGWLHPFETVAWESVQRLVFVCAGNICRSAYAQARAQAMGLPTVSFGLAACTGTPADPVAAKVAQRRQVDMSSHRAQGADDVRLGPGDLLVAMEIPQARWLRPLTRLGPQITLLGLWCRPRRPHLEDPFGLSEEYFDICFSCIDSAIDAIARQMAKAKLRAHAGWIPA